MRVPIAVRWPRSRDARREALALALVGLIFLAFLFPALRYARREYRDGLRRQALRTVKVELEHWFNERGGFPLHPSGDPGWCGSTDDPEDWFFADFFLGDREQPRPLRDPLRAAGYVFRYCPTSVAEPPRVPPLAAGFFLEARLENPQPERAQFNTEHNVFERTLVEHGRTLYRLCGGAEAQCGTEKPE